MRMIRFAIGLLSAAGCASTGGGGDVSTVKVAAGEDAAAIKAEVQADLQAALARIEARIGHLEATIGALDVSVSALHTGNIGGGGDSVTAWLYAAIAGAAVLYPLVIRPIRKRLEEREFQKTVTKARMRAHARGPPPTEP